MREELLVKTYFNREGDESFTVQLLLQEELHLTYEDSIIIIHDFTVPDKPNVRVFIERKEIDD